MRKSTSWLLPFALAILCWAGATAFLAMQEVPTGWVQGKVLTEESGQPLVGAEINLHRIVPPLPEAENDFVFWTRAGGAFRSPRLPAGVYRIEAHSQAHALKPTSLVVEEGKISEVTLELQPDQPSLQVRMPQHVFTPDETPELTAHGFFPDATIQFRLYQVDPTALFRQHRGDLQELLKAAPRAHLERNPALTKVEERSLPATRRDVEGVLHQRFQLPVREPGLYLLEARVGDLQQLDWLMVTRLGLVVKRWAGNAFAFVTDLKTGEPVPGAAVEFLGEDRRSVRATTDGDGLCAAQLPRAEEGYDLLALAEAGGSYAYLTTWVEPGGEADQDRLYVYTDRPVYRPGHQVRFKGIARRFQEPTYSVLAKQPVKVEVWDSRETLVYRRELTTNEFGSYDGELSLSDEAATGAYRVASTLAGREHESGFQVAEYRKPEYSIEVTTDKKRYTRGEKMRVRVNAQYYFGAPVAGADVSYWVSRSPYWFYPGEEAEEYQGDEYEGYDYGEVIEQGTATTDADGVAVLTIPTRRPLGEKQAEGGEEAESYRYTVSISVTDASRKQASGAGSALVTAGEFALIATPARYLISPGDSAQVMLKARDYDRHPVAGAQVRVTADRERWSAGRMSVEPLATGAITTDSKGEGAFRFTPQVQGYYRVQATAHDRRGNLIRAVTAVWVTGEYASDLEATYPELEIVADKKSYQVGETATLLINSKVKDVTSLVCVEGSRLYDHQLLRLKGNSTRVQVPIRPEYAPDFFVSVSFVKNKRFFDQEKRINVSVAEHGLRVTVRADKEVYSPGERAVYQLAAANVAGRPVQAELSIGVVDESIYAIQEDTAGPMLGFFYPPRGNAVSTTYSFPEIYLDADKGAVGVKVRRRFPDTAYWNPTVVTGPDGKAQVSFAMPDTLTTWRATVRGATLATEVGEAVAKVKCTKDLLVRLAAPRFFVQKDRLTISAVVHNYSAKRQDLELWMDAPGLSFVGGVRAAQPDSFSLDPERLRRKDWQIEVPSPGQREVTVYVKAASGLSDAMALTLPALPHGRERVEWRSGAVQEEAIERLTVRRDTVPGTSELRVRLSPSLASMIIGALDYLVRYPYGCTEQTMSAFLPDVVVARAMKELDVPNPELEKRLPDMVRKGFDRLYGFQHESDGGWGWWRYDDTDPWMTAYVVFGLLTAREAGFAVNERALSRGLEWLAEYLKKGQGPVGDRAYVVSVLALADKDGLVNRQLTDLYRQAHGLDARSLALVTVTLARRGRRTQAEEAADLLWKRAETGQATTWWHGAESWGRGGDVETTALAFKALFEVNPGDPRLLKVVRWLALNREGNHWTSTRDTAFVLYALTDFLKRSGELRPDYQATVTLDGKPLLARRFTQDDLFNPEVEVRVAAENLAAGDHLLSVKKQGVGSLYYTIVSRQVVAQEDIPQLITGAGISVERSYYRLVSQRDPRTGVITTLPSPKPITDFRSGEPVLVRLTIRSPREYEYVVVEDPLPAGCEVSERGDLERWEWDRWYSDMDVRDEKVAVFARRLPAGSAIIEYHLQPQIPGDYHVMPTQVYSMYNPELRGSGPETRVRLR